MEGLPGDVRIDARVVVEHLRSIVGDTPGPYPRTWMPQATFDELLSSTDREALHLHPGLHHLHHHWDMVPALNRPQGGRGPKARIRRAIVKILRFELEHYHTEEQEFRAALAQTIDAIAYRVDEIAYRDERALLDLVRRDLLSLARYVDERDAARDTDR